MRRLSSSLCALLVIALLPAVAQAQFIALSQARLAAPKLSPLAKPEIRSISPGSCSQPGGIISINGSGFGSASGKGVALGGNGQHVDLQVQSWSENRIGARIPSGRGLKPGRRYYVGVERSDHSAWLSNISVSLLICANGGSGRLSTPSATPGKTTSSGGFGMPSLAPLPGGVSVAVPPSGGGGSGGSGFDSDGWGNGSAHSGPATPSSGGSLIGSGFPPPPEIPQVANQRQQQDVEPDELLVVSSDMVSAMALAQQLQGQGVRVKRRQRLEGLGVVISTLGLPQGSSVADQLAQLRQSAPDLWLDANHRYRPLQGADNAWSQGAIGWKAGSGCGRGLRMGLLDTQADPTLTAVGERLHQKSLLSRGVTPADTGHGTGLAYLLAGSESLLPQSELYLAGVFRSRDGNSETTSELIIRGLDWLVKQRVSVINLSLGGSRNLVLELVLQRLVAQGIGLVAAAGNSGPDGPPVYPAAQPGVVAVSALDSDQRPYANGNRGDYIDLAAPGVELALPAPGSRVYRSGSSYATPFVSAALALQMAAGNGPGKALEDLAARAEDLGDPGRDPVFGWGLLRHPGCVSNVKQP